MIQAPSFGTMQNPDYLASLGIAAGFINFLHEHHAKVRVVDTWNIPLEAMVGSHPNRQKVRRTQFLNTGEGYLFSELICLAAHSKEANAVTHIIDLGTGSGLPSLRALWESHQYNKRLHTLTGVDIDPEAVAIAQSNAKILGIERHADFLCRDITDFLKSASPEPNDMVVANPPYIPVPDNIIDPFFIPIHAGNDGLKYLRPILHHSWQPGTIVCLFASSLSSPTVLQKEILSGYEILYLTAHLVPFGKYINDERILPYLEDLRARNEITFGISKEGKRYFVSLGFILRKNR